MRRLLLIASVLTACSAEFPPAADGAVEPGFDQGGATDATLRGDDPPVDASLRPDPSAADLGPAPDLAVIDAVVIDAAPPPPPVPEVRLAVVEQVPERGCVPREVVLEWETRAVDGCTVTGAPGDFTYDVPLITLSLGSVRVPAVAQNTEFTIECSGDWGAVDAAVGVELAVALPPEQRFDRRDAVREEQRRCALALGQTAIDDDGQVYADRETAARVCQCAGYTQLLDASNERRCFASPHDNTLVRWRDEAWRVERASRHNRCLDVVRCGQPVEACEALIYAR